MQDKSVEKSEGQRVANNNMNTGNRDAVAKHNSDKAPRSSFMWKAIVCIIVIAGAVWCYQSGVFHSKETVLQEVSVPTVVVQPVTEFDASTKESEFVGRAVAIQSVTIKPQISGKIAKVCFEEGSVVQEGQLLYEIDPSEYSATVQLRKAELEKAQAELTTAEKYYKRTQAASSKAVSATDRDTAEGNYLSAKAAISQAKANLRLAQIDLNYCKITSPITGKIGKTNYTKGNYVTPSTESLATVVQMDPIRVTYPLTDKEYLNQLELFKADGSVFNTRIVLSNGSAYDMTGQRDFEDNTIDTMTGTITMTLRFDNKDGQLIPGEMVRVYTKNIKPEIVDVVPQTAIMSDRNGDYVFVVKDGVAEQRRIRLGRVFDADREVIEGLKTGETVAVAGLHNLHDGSKVSISKEVE